MTIGCVALGLLIASAAACSEAAKPDQAGSSAPAATTAATASTSASPATSAAPSATVTATASADLPAASAQASAQPSASGAKAASTGAPASSAKADTTEVKGEEKTGAAFSAYMSSAKSYKAGQPGTVTAIVNALGDYHVNPEFPYKVKLDAAPSGVSYPQDTIRDVSRSEKRASMSIPFTASQAGSSTISGTISLSVCTKDQCVIEKAPVSVTVKVE